MSGYRPSGLAGDEARPDDHMVRNKEGTFSPAAASNRRPAWQIRPVDDVQDMPGRYQVEARSGVRDEAVTG